MARARGRALAALLLAGAVVAACTGDTGSNGGSRPSAPPEIGFDVRGGDSYAWAERIIGRAECGDVTLERNGEPLAVSVDLNGESFVARVPLVPGSNEVVASCGTQDGAARSEPVVFNQRLEDGPTARVDVSVRGATVVLDAGASTPSGVAPARITEYSWTPGNRRVGGGATRLRTAAGQVFREASGQRLQLRAPSEDGEYFVTLSVVDAQGRRDTSTTYFVVSGGRARAVDMMNEHPPWIDRAVVYAPIPALWGNGGPKAVERRLPYLRKLGVDALWLWPPTSLRTAGEEYAIADYFEVDPSWGPRKALEDMVDRAHELGMYVLIDFVPNHMSAESPYFVDAQERGPLSSYWRFFDRRDGEPTHYFDWDHLPNLNYDNPEVRRMILEASAFWVRDVGVDGFRMDVAWGVKRRKPDFWPQWRREMKRINPDLMLLAEASAVNPYYFANGFDVAYDWTRSLGQWAWSSAFEFPQEAGVLLQSAITNGGKGYSDDAVILRFLNNNDTGIRFVDQHGAKLTRVAATMQFTLPGVPALFAGDEIGASYEPYSNLTPIPWRDRHRLRPHYERLIELKHSLPALNASSRALAILETNTNSALAYIRPGFEGGEPLLVVLNFGIRSRVRLSGAPALDDVLANGGGLRDLLSGRTVTVSRGSAGASIQMPAESAVVLSPGGG